MRFLSSSFNSVTRRERPALPALRVATEGPAPRLGRPLMHVQWGVALRAPVQGRSSINRRRAKNRQLGGKEVVDDDYRIYVGIDWATEPQPLPPRGWRKVPGTMPLIMEWCG
jgi:hypothetical protein